MGAAPAQWSKQAERHKAAAAALALIAWGRLGRPATDDEVEDVLAALVLEERDRVLGRQDSE